MTYYSTVSHFNLHSKRGRSMAPRSWQVLLSCPSSLQGHSDFPTFLTPILSVSSGLTDAYRSRSSAETLGSQVPHRYLSPHAVGLTPGPMQVSIPFASLHALAFSQYVQDRRISPLCGVYPSPRLSQLFPSGYILRSCTIRFMLRPAVLASTPGWVRPASLRAFSVPCQGKFSPHVTMRTRPLPTHP
jgi:hypothetical protein